MRAWIAALVLVACGARTGLRTGAGAGATDSGATDSGSDGPVLACAALGSIATTGALPDAIALDGAYVYWHDADGISRVPKSGGTPVLVASTAAHFWPQLAPFVIGGTNLFFGDANDRVSVVALAGGPATPTSTSLPVAAFGASASHVYAWSQAGGPTRVVRFAFDGSGGAQVDDLTHPPNEMVFEPPETAYAVSDPDVRQIDYSGKTGMDFLLSGLTATDVVVSGTDVYFTSDDATNGARVMTVSTQTLKVSPIADTFGAFALAQDDHDLYFTDGNALRVRRLAKKTGPVTDVATVGPDFAPIDVVVDATCVYFTSAKRNDDTAPGAVMVAPKP